jgi:hypothetical protein
VQGSSPDSSPAPQQDQPTVINTVWQDPDTFNAHERAEALEHQQQRLEGIDHQLQHTRLQREARKRKAIKWCQANGTSTLRYCGLHGDAAYRVLLADWYGVRREMNEAMPRLLRRSQRLRAARPPALTNVPRTVAPRRSTPPGGRPRAQASRSSSRSGHSPDDGPEEPAAADLIAGAASVSRPTLTDRQRSAGARRPRTEGRITRGRVSTSTRVRKVVWRAGGSLPEHLVIARLAVVYSDQWARDAVRYALLDVVVVRVYCDGRDALILPDEPRPRENAV